ncbi:HAD hydrolase%2C family IB [Bordetella pertussis]|nr:HAD hydrolase%2C family IB [Bordetella pertussis]
MRVNQWLAGMGLALGDFAESYFYSDSVNDVPLLEAVTRPIAANPSPGLREIAQARGWQVIDLFDHLEDAKS